MLLKLLFTFGVVIVGILVIRHKGAARDGVSDMPPLIQAVEEKKMPVIKVLMVMVFSIMLLGASAFGYFHWSDNQQMMLVKVVNANDGKTVTYHAKKGDVYSSQGYFVTLDGRKVTLSGVDRLELMPVD